MAYHCCSAPSHPRPPTPMTPGTTDAPLGGRGTRGIVGCSRPDHPPTVPMSTLDSTKPLLGELLAKVVKSRLQPLEFPPSGQASAIVEDSDEDSSEAA